MSEIASAPYTHACENIRDVAWGINYPPSEFPVDIELGRTIRALVAACSYTSGYSLCKLNQWLIDPTGQQVGYSEDQKSLYQGWCMFVYGPNVALNKLGMWKLRTQLFVEGALYSDLTYNAINCVEEAEPPPPEISCKFWRLTDRTGGWAQYPEEDLPVDIYEGHEVTCSFQAKNEGVSGQDVQVEYRMWMTAPNGQGHGFRQGTHTLKPGFPVSFNSEIVTLHQLGWWQFYAELYMDGTRIYQQNWTVLRCIEYTYPEPKATLNFWTVTDRDNWKHYYLADLPVPLQIGTKVEVTSQGKNTNYVRQYMRQEVWLVDPAGQVRGYRKTNWSDIDYGWDHYAKTEITTLDKVGHWTFHAILYAQVKKNGPEEPGTLMDSKSWHVIVAEEEPPPTEGAVTGTVLNADTGDPVSGVKVSSPDHPAHATTNAQGWYEITGIEAGSYMFSYSKNGFLPSTRNVAILGGVTTRQDVLLFPHENGNGNGEEPEFQFPWLLVGLGAVVAAAVATHRKLRR